MSSRRWYGGTNGTVPGVDVGRERILRTPMRLLILTLIVYTAAVTETSLVDVTRIGHVTPDLLALTAIVYVLMANHPSAFVVSGLIALVGDLIAPGHLGVGMGWMLLLGFGLTRLKRHVPLEHLAAQVFAVLAAVSVWAAAVGLTGRVLGDVSLPWLTIVARSAGVGLYTAGVAVPVLMILGWIHEPHLTTDY